VETNGVYSDTKRLCELLDNVASDAVAALWMYTTRIDLPVRLPERRCKILEHTLNMYISRTRLLKIVVATLKIPEAIFVESFLSFIGLGVSIPMASLGSLAQTALKGIYSYPYMLFFPAATISIIILSINLFGDGLRDALDQG